MTEKRATDAIMRDFYKTYRKKLTKWAKQLCRAYAVPEYIHEDLVQSALLRVHTCIHAWDPHKANLWTYTWLGMRKSMLCDVREYHHQRPYSTKPIERFIVSEEDRIFADTRESLSIEERITLKDVCLKAAHGRSKGGNRFMLFALEGAKISQLAREESVSVKRISRQGYWNSIDIVQSNLQQELRDFYE